MANYWGIILDITPVGLLPARAQTRDNSIFICKVGVGSTLRTVTVA